MPHCPSDRVMKQCLMLAAGLSSRMGQWKMMLPWGATTVLDCALENALAFCDKVVLVTGHRADELAQRYRDDARILLAFNPAYTCGMFSSIRCGARQLEPGDFFVVPGDMPQLSGEIYAALWQQRTAETCLVPQYKGRGGHPVLLPATMRATLLAQKDGDTLKRLINQGNRRNIPLDCEAIHWDLDTPARYHALRRQLTSDHTF